MTVLKSQIKRIQEIVSLIENAQAISLDKTVETEQEEFLGLADQLILQINTGENEFLFI